MSEPHAMIRFSDDNGRTWSAEQWVPLGEEGDYLARAVLHAQGSSRNRLYDITYSENSGFTIIAGWADIGLSL